MLCLLIILCIYELVGIFYVTCILLVSKYYYAYEVVHKCIAQKKKSAKRAHRHHQPTGNGKISSVSSSG